MTKQINTKYYLAYGSNLNVEQMAFRCPGAKRVGRTTINNHRLVFRGEPGNAHASIEVAKGHKVPVMVWAISMRNEIALDAYEGVPYYYRKEYFPIRVGGKVHNALVYIMNGKDLEMPSAIYYGTVKRGYKDCGLDYEILEEALNMSTAHYNHID